MKLLITVLNFLPPKVPFAVTGTLLVVVGGTLWTWADACERAPPG